MDSPSVRSHVRPQFRSRRGVLAAVGSTLVLAGCTSDGDARTTNGDGEPREDDDQLEFFRSYLEDHDVAVVSLEIVENTVELVYATEAVSDDQLADEIGTIAGGYTLAHDDGLESDRLESVISDGSDQLATWYVQSAWVEEFNNGEIPPETFSTKILNTVELLD